MLDYYLVPLCVNAIRTPVKLNSQLAQVVRCVITYPTTTTIPINMNNDDKIPSMLTIGILINLSFFSLTQYNYYSMLTVVMQHLW